MADRAFRPGKFLRFSQDILQHTRFVLMSALLTVTWVIFAIALWAVERGNADTSIETIPDALYWGVTAFTTAGLGGEPQTGMGLLVGGIWILLGSLLFLGTVVGTLTAYFMRPVESPGHQLISAIEDDLHRLDELSQDQLSLLKKTVDNLIENAADDSAA